MICLCMIITGFILSRHFNFLGHHLNPLFLNIVLYHYVFFSLLNIVIITISSSQLHLSLAPFIQHLDYATNIQDILELLDLSVPSPGLYATNNTFSSGTDGGSTQGQGGSVGVFYECFCIV